MSSRQKGEQGKERERQKRDRMPEKDREGGGVKRDPVYREIFCSNETQMSRQTAETEMEKHEEKSKPNEKKKWRQKEEDGVFPCGMCNHWIK